MPEGTQPPTNPTPPPRRKTNEPAPAAAPPAAERPAAPALGSANYPTILDGVNARDVVWVFEVLHKQPEEANHSSPENGWTPLHVAAMNDDFRMAELLLRFGARVDDPNSAGKNAMHDAAGKGYGEVVKLLLDHGADPSIKYKDETAADRARRGGFEDVAVIIESHGKEPAAG